MHRGHEVPSFPNDFLWGAATSAHQVEGESYNNDWWQWEQRLGNVQGDASSQLAAGHKARYRADFDLARRLGHNAHLMSLEWSRIQPTENEYDQTALAHYREVLSALKARNMTPVCVLHHVALPVWFAERHGWADGAAAQIFAAYAAHVASELGDLCKWWIPILEPVHTLSMGFLHRRWPPASRNIYRAWAALKNMMRGHAAAYAALHEVHSDAMAGPALRMRRVSPLDSDSPWDLRVARCEEYRSNRMFLEAVVRGRAPLGPKPMQALKGSADFIGVSFYGKETVRVAPLAPRCLFAAFKPEAKKTYVSFPAYERNIQAFEHVLRVASSYDLPLLVTGNGLATERDVERADYIQQHILALGACMDSGLDIRGYFHRSLLDSFEWEQGYQQRFGLVHVDRETMARTPNPSAYIYKEICETGRIDAKCASLPGKQTGQVEGTENRI